MYVHMYKCGTHLNDEDILDITHESLVNGNRLGFTHISL